eukprot:6479420-Amphidinium_carterae.2
MSNRQTMQLQQCSGLMHEIVYLTIGQGSPEAIESRPSHTMGKLALRSNDSYIRDLVRVCVALYIHIVVRSDHDTLTRLACLFKHQPLM